MYRLVRKSLGIGLLELMLSLAIIAVLLIMATRYYQSASENNKRNNAVDMFSAVNGAIQSWKIDQPPGTISGGATVQQLIGGGYLPPSYGSTGDGVAPWGGDIKTIFDDAVSGTYQIQMTGVPLNSCTPLKNRVNSTIAAAGALSETNTTCDGTTLTATYNF